MMVAETNENYINSLITSLGETYPQISGRQKKAEEETDLTRSSSEVSATDDTIELSPQAQKKAEQNQNPSLTGQAEELSQEEKQEVRELKETDRKVHAHEQAHMAAGGNLVKGAASYEYRTGPDGHRYAVAGEVTIDTSEVEGDPQATILKAAHIRRAALAPADPSAQDRAVAAEAATMAYRARIELQAQNNKNQNKSQPQSLRIDLFA
jgi:hypothetical protein